MKPSPAIAFLGPATCVVVLLLVAPLGLLARYSLNKYDPTELMIEAATPANYLRFFTEAFYWDVMRTTIVVALLVTCLCLLLGLPLAYRLARTTSRWKSAMMLMVVLPLFIGSTVRTVGWMILFAQRGVLDSLSVWLFGLHIDLMYTPSAVVIGTLSVNLPFMVLTLQSVFEGIDSRLEEAAQGLGAAPGRAFWKIVWPLALPGVGIAAVLSFILGMNAYATPVLLGGPRFQMMAPLLFWEFNTNNNWPFSAALGFILMATTLLLTTLANVLIPRRYRA
ncbi:MAG: putative spermidine/putrescine transport system permease protein [Acetobacteraceae bacterium]|nr:putative spermidine/putrescine transport system permease protein [Acetobacteraceae bacterium]